MPALPPDLVSRNIKLTRISKHSSAILNKVELHRPDVLLLPTALEGYPLFALLPRLRARVPATEVLVTSERRDQKFIVAILRQGAAGCVRPASTPAALAKAILAVKNGDIWLERRSLAKVLGYLMQVGSGLHKVEPAASAAQRNPPLTYREMQIAALVGQGFTNKEIAKRLSISDQTVKKHLKHIFAKLGVHSRTEAVLLSASYFNLMSPIYPPFGV
jgi:DNA-binding NarL/FixJ family response regulator